MTTNPTTNDTLTAVPGFHVGHQTDLDAATGCTVILCPPDTVGGVDQRGGAPGTRETDLLRPLHLVQIVNAVALSGGSAFGLATADGVMTYLSERGVGFPAGGGHVVPIVPAAILSDLDVGAPRKPDAGMGYAACLAATADPVSEGNVGAGTGCRIAALFGNGRATKGGLGTAAIRLDGGLVVAALCVVNPVGDVIDERGQIIAGLRDAAQGDSFVGVLNAMRDMAYVTPPTGSNTVLGVVATNARLTKDAANLVAQMAHDGLARAINPAHTLFDGDIIFTLASGTALADVNLVGALAAEVVAAAIRRGALAASTLGGIRAASDKLPLSH